jgi:hypothetical protein
LFDSRLAAPLTAWSPPKVQHEIVVALPIGWNPRRISEQRLPGIRRKLK